MNRLKLGSLAFLLLVSLLASTLSPFAPTHKASADAGLNILCIPQNSPYVLSNGKNGGWQPSGWLSLQWIDRATLKLVYTPSGKCASPPTADEQFIAASSPFGPLIEGNYVAQAFHTGTLVYNLPNTSNKISAPDGSLNAAMYNSQFKNSDAKVDVATINTGFSMADFLIRIDPAKAAVAGASCTGNQAGGSPGFTLSTSNSDPNSALGWLCLNDRTAQSAIGFMVANSFANPNNFNITYRVSGSGNATTILSVLDSANKYVWCASDSKFHHVDCTQAQTIDGTPASYAQLGATLGDAHITNASGQSEIVTVAGPNSDSAQAATSTSGGGGGNSTTALQCEASGWTLAWIACPVINAVTDASDYIFNNAIAPLLNTTAVNSTGKDVSGNPDPTFVAWTDFRNIADILLVIGVIVIVMAQSIGGGLLEAYTVKKVLPRILLAAILINLSIYIVAIMVDLSNIVGSGIYGLLTTPFKDAGFAIRLNGGSSAVLGLTVVVGLILAKIAGTAALGKAGLLLLLFVVMPVLLAIFGVLLTLIIRRGIILLLIIVSPVAFALYVLPNTEKYFRQWWKLLFETLLVYPIVFAVFAIARILPSVVTQSNDTGGITSAIAGLIAIILAVAPLFLVPYAFKLAGGLIGNLHNQFTSWRKKGQETVKGDARNPLSLQSRAKRGAAEAFLQSRARYVDATRAQEHSSRRRRLVSRGLRSLGGDVDEKLAMYTAEQTKIQEAMTATGRDDLAYAGGGFILRQGETLGYDAKLMDGTTLAKGTAAPSTMFMDSRGKQISETLYREGKSKYGSSASQLGQALRYRLGKVQTDEDVAQFRDSFKRNVEARGLTQREVGDVWAAATYPQKGTISSEWYSTPTLDAAGNVSFKDISTDPETYGKFIGDLHKTRQSYQLGQLRDQDFRAMYGKQQELEAKVISGTASDDDKVTLARTYETFDAVSQRMATVNAGTGDQEIAAAGATAASKAIIEGAVGNRQLALSNSSSDGSRNLTARPTPGVGGPVTTYGSVKTTGDIDRGPITGI